MKPRAVAALLLLACLSSKGASAAPPAPVTDDLGVQVALPAPPQRIVSLAPSITEMLFALGLGDRLVGVTEYCNHPPAARGITTVAGFSDLNVERVIAARPDLVVASRGNDPEGLQALRQLGVPVFGLAADRLSKVVDGLRRLGRLTGAPQASAVADSLQDRLDAVAARLPTVGPRPRVLWGMPSQPIYTAGSGSIIDDIITRAGGENVGARAGTGWPQVSLEVVVGWQPQVLLTSLRLAADDSLAAVRAAELERLRGLDGWRQLPAVRAGRLVHVNADVLSRPGPRAVTAVEILAAALHPKTSPAAEPAPPPRGKP